MLLTYFSLSFTLLIILSFYAFFIGFVDEYDTIEKVTKNVGIIEERTETFQNMNNQIALPFDKPFSNENTYILYNDGSVKGLNSNVTTINFDIYQFKDLTNKDIVGLYVGNKVKKIYGATDRKNKHKWEARYGMLPNLSKLIFLPGGTDELFIYYAAFDKSKIEEILLPERTKFLSSSVFNNCKSLKTLYIPHNIKLNNISKACFQSCTSLTQLYLPSSITKIGNFAFRNCRNLDFIICSSNLDCYPSYYYSNVAKRQIKQKNQHFKNTKLANTLNKVTNNRNIIFALDNDTWEKQFYITGLMNDQYEPQIYKDNGKKEEFKWIQKDNKKVLNLEENAVDNSYMFLQSMNNNIDNTKKNQFILSGYHQALPFESDINIPKQPEYNNIIIDLTEKNIPDSILNMYKKDNYEVNKEIDENINTVLNPVDVNDTVPVVNIGTIKQPDNSITKKPVQKPSIPLNDNTKITIPQDSSNTNIINPNDPIKVDEPKKTISIIKPSNPPENAEIPDKDPPSIPGVNVPSKKPLTQIEIQEKEQEELNKKVAKENAERNEEIRLQKQAEAAFRKAAIEAGQANISAKRKRAEFEKIKKEKEKADAVKKQAVQQLKLAKDSQERKKAEQAKIIAEKEARKKAVAYNRARQQAIAANNRAKKKSEEAGKLRKEAIEKRKIVEKRIEEEKKRRDEERKKKQEEQERKRKEAEEKYLKAKKEREEQERKRKEAEEEAKKKAAEEEKARLEAEKAERARKQAELEEKRKKQEEERLYKLELARIAAEEAKRAEEEEAKRLAEEARKRAELKKIEEQRLAEEARKKAEEEERLRKIEEERLRKLREAAELKAKREKNLEDAKRKIEEDAKRQTYLWDQFIAKEKAIERSIDDIFVNTRPKQSSSQKLNTNMTVSESTLPLGDTSYRIETSQDMMNCEKRIFSSTDPKGWTCAAPMPTRKLEFDNSTNVEYHDSIEDIKAQNPDSNLDLNKEYIYDDIGNEFEYMKAIQQNNIKYDGIGKYKYGYDNYTPKYHETVHIADLTETAKKEAEYNVEKLNKEYSFTKENPNDSTNTEFINNFISPRNQLILPKKRENVFDYNSNIDSFNRNNVIWSLAQQDNLFNN